MRRRREPVRTSAPCSCSSTTRTFELQRLKDRFLSSVSHELRTPLTSHRLLRVAAHDPRRRHRVVELVAASSARGAATRCARRRHVRLPAARERRSSVRGRTGRWCSWWCAASSRPSKRTFAAATSNSVWSSPPTCRCWSPIDGASSRSCATWSTTRWKFRPTAAVCASACSVATRAGNCASSSGPGVPPNDRATVFEKFSQLRDHLTEKLPGTGLNLATSRAIVACLGGLIWCEDSPLGGAGFVVLLLPGVGQPRLAAIGAGTGAGGGVLRLRREACAEALAPAQRCSCRSREADTPTAPQGLCVRSCRGAAAACSRSRRSAPVRCSSARR